MSGTTTNYTDDFVNQAIATMQSVAATFPNPADQIRILTPFCEYESTTNLPANLMSIQNAVAAMLRRAALSVIATTCASYQPTSVQDAQNVLTQVRALFDAEIDYAADNFEDDITNSLTRLSQSIIVDLKSRSTNLPTLNYYNLAAGVPPVVIAARLYGDVSRADEVLTLNNNVPHPFFFPADFYCLSR